MVSSWNEGHVTGDGGQSCLEGVASGGEGTVVTRQVSQSSVTSLHLDEDGRRVCCRSCDWGVWLSRRAAFCTCLAGTTGGAVGRPQANGHQEGGDKTKHLHKTIQFVMSRMSRTRK